MKFQKILALVDVELSFGVPLSDYFSILFCVFEYQTALVGPQVGLRVGLQVGLPAYWPKKNFLF